MNLLDFELQHPTNGASKENAVRSEFGVGLARYYQQLNAVLDSAAGLEANPMAVYGLLEVRDGRAKARALRRIGRSVQP